MLQNATKSQIGERVKAINLSLSRLARLAGVDPMTVHRGPKRVVSRDAVDEALIAEEIRLARHLASLPHVQAALAERSAA